LQNFEALAARLLELQAPRLRIDHEGLARGYRSLEGLPAEGVAHLLRETLESLRRTYPQGRIQVIAQWPGSWPEPVRRVVLAEAGEAEGDAVAI